MSGTTAALGLPYPTDGDLVQLVDESIQSLAEATEAILLGTAGGWQNITLPGGVTAISTGTFGVPGCRLTSGNLVVCRGLVNGGALGAAMLIGTLPVGYRPVFNMRIATQVASSGGGSQAGIVNVSPTGAIQIEYFSTAGTLAAASFAFSFTRL